MQRIAALLIILSGLIGCATSPADNGMSQESTLRAQNAALQEKLAMVVAQKQEVQHQLEEARRQGGAQLALPQAPPIPRYVCAGLGQYVYLELAAGRKPLDVLDEQDVLVGFSAKGHPDPVHGPPDMADYAPVMEWAAKNPVTLVKRVALVLSQPGYQRVDMSLTNGFVVQVICHQYRVQRFLILDQAPGMS